MRGSGLSGRRDQGTPSAEEGNEVGEERGNTSADEQASTMETWG